MVSEVLTKLNIPFIQQVKHALLPNRKYDFYFSVEGIHYILEYDGEQHFHPKFYGRTQEEFNYHQNIDRIKTYVAVNTGYNVIRIDYTQINNIYNCILNALAFKAKLYVSLNEMYTWLSNSTIPLELLQKECPGLCYI